jgi:hypothetical protein
LAFWTLSVWESELSLHKYLRGSPHREAMPKLFPWCDEAATAHWDVGSQDLPTWQEATGQLLKVGRLLRVKYPSQNQSAGVTNVT